MNLVRNNLKFLLSSLCDGKCKKLVLAEKIKKFPVCPMCVRTQLFDQTNGQILIKFGI